MQRRAGALASVGLALLMACASRSSDAGAAERSAGADVAVGFSTHADPPTHELRPDARPLGSGPRGLASYAGADRARRLLVDLALAIRDGDERGIEALLAEEIAIAPAARRGHPAPTMTRGAWVRQLLAQARVAGLSSDTRFEELIVPASIRVEAASVFFPRGALPPELSPGDLVLRFDLAPAGRRALGTLAPGGSGTLVVRPGDETRVIAR